MTAADPAAFVARWTRAARWRSTGGTLAIGLAPAAALAVLLWRMAGPGAALAGAGVGAAAAIAVALWRARRFDRQWLVRALDRQRGDMEDSADLLVVDDAGLGPLQRLQRARLQARLGDDTGALAPPLAWRPIAIAWAIAAVIMIAVLAWPASRPLQAGGTPGGSAVAAGPPRLVGQRLRVVPPAYTGLPVRDGASLDGRFPQGSRLEWRFRFVPDPAAVGLVSPDGRRIALQRHPGDWAATILLDRSLLYRVVADGMAAVPAPPLHRIDAIPDAPPVIRVVTPDRTLSLLAQGQTRWPLVFDVSDDHGVAAAARLRLVVTTGAGENIRFRETAMVIAGTGEARHRRFVTSLDPRALGLTAGNDLVAQLVVADNRAPAPQEARSPSLILRWPIDLGRESTGLDGMVRTELPAYFRSQRQIIIDAEALVAARRQLPAAAFAERSDRIGVDQRILRQRYGQFVGDENGGEPPALPTSDAPAAAPAPGDDDHGHAKPAVVGRADDVLADYGHAHDESDAATLLDPATRDTLRQALDAMWDSERALRQGDPEHALPPAHTALRLIKQVQQATRVFLSRVGPELPPIDPTRRLKGDRKDLGAPDLALAAPPPEAEPAATWRALARPGGGAVPLGALQAWLRSNPARVADPLALAAAIDTVERDPACAQCRAALAGRLWTVLAPPPAAVPRRPAADAAGRAYLDALP